MKGARQSGVESSRVRLLDLWAGEEAFGKPLGCVTTTFTFDGELFEEQCLARFLSIQSNPNETAKAYLIEREEKLSECFACVLVDRAHVAPERSLRWNLLPVTLPLGGVMHAKLTLLVWQNHARLLVSSANLTEPGYRQNQEMMAAFDFGHNETAPPELLSQSAAFLNQVRAYAPGIDQVKLGPQPALAKFLKVVERRASTLPSAEDTGVNCKLIALVPGAPKCN
jgi:hypothetical protein